MNHRNRSHFNGTYTPKYFALALLVVAGLCLTGCSNQMAIMQENQASLQALVQENARQMSDLVTCMEQSQKELKVTMQSLRDTTQQLSDDMTLVTVAHSDLKKTVQQKNTVIVGRVDSVEQRQEALTGDLASTDQERKKLAASIANEEAERLALAGMVRDNETVFLSKMSEMQGSQVALQSELKSLKLTIQGAVADIGAVVVAHKTLEETVDNTVAGQAAMQENQSLQQTQLDDSKVKIEKLLNGLAGLETNLTQLERILTEDISNLSKAVELANEQVQGQMNATQKVTDVQSNTHTMIENLKDDLQQVKTLVEEISTVQVNQPEILSSDESTP